MASTSSIQVRPATLADLAFVSRDAYVSEERVARMITDGQVYLATRGEEPVGYARVEYLWSRIPYLALLWVQEEHRRCGAGRALLTRIECLWRWLIRLRRTVEGFMTGRAPVTWHRRMGFTECGYIAGINRGGVGEVFFRKPLGEPAVAS